MAEPYDPLLYALVHSGTPGDLAFYEAQCAGADSVLELGCGYGRVVVNLAVAGHRVVGVDLDGGLLDLARAACEQLDEPTRARVSLLEQDMRALELDERFDRVLLPHSGLYCLLSDDDVRACLRGAFAALRPGGRLVLDAYAADAFHHENTPEDHPDDQLDEVALIAADGVVYDVYERSRWLPEEQRILASYVYRPDGGGTDRVFEIDQRYLLRPQLEALLSECGFDVVQVTGDFEGGDYDDESELIAVVAERPASPPVEH